MFLFDPSKTIQKVYIFLHLALARACYRFGTAMRLPDRRRTLRQYGWHTRTSAGHQASLSRPLEALPDHVPPKKSVKINRISWIFIEFHRFSSVFIGFIDAIVVGQTARAPSRGHLIGD